MIRDASAARVEPVEDPRPLRIEARGREHLVRLAGGILPQPLERRRQLGVAPRAGLAPVQVLTRGSPPIGAGLLVAEVQGDEPVVSGMEMVHFHRFPPSSERSFRTARKRCTRTVDSFNPVIVLTSFDEHPS